MTSIGNSKSARSLKPTGCASRCCARRLRSPPSEETVAAKRFERINRLPARQRPIYLVFGALAAGLAGAAVAAFAVVVAFAVSPSRQGIWRGRLDSGLRRGFRGSRASRRFRAAALGTTGSSRANRRALGAFGALIRRAPCREPRLTASRVVAMEDAFLGGTVERSDGRVQLGFTGRATLFKQRVARLDHLGAYGGLRRAVAPCFRSLDRMRLRADRELAMLALLQSAITVRAPRAGSQGRTK